jgi:hypothetical protein
LRVPAGVQTTHSSKPQSGKQSGPAVSALLHVAFDGQAPASPASEPAAVHFWKQSPPSWGFCVAKPVPPGIDRGRSASHTRPAGQPALVPETQKGAQMPPLAAPPSGDLLKMMQLHAPLVMSALVQAAPGALVGGTTVVTQMPRSGWHALPAGQSMLAVQPAKQ